ncbi:hypothetical protein DEIPH_ctg011orf0229 [Deinococcus phoenicis]|uniref:GGDEF domain-containing protein n=1 Tax=Deinococcus phoenicis TaxID=1476583 RepID=A0A016QTW3_9DEIO|nr:sensor domain-containing diguanylate cyclase [Deinococcus phoenicis]EYB69234.1 hypothetical protein DEIPH_ctg011orf0229 [Deinococcus phoenicis]
MTVLATPTELARLEALARYAIVEGVPEASFTRVAELAAQFFRAPVALLNFVTSDRTWSKACVGVDLLAVDRQLSFCARTIEQDGVLVSPDLSQDSRFLNHPVVRGEGGYRFYAGAPLRTPDGFNIGTLCVLDYVPRAEVTALEREALANLAALAVEGLELRRAQLEAEREAVARQQLVEGLRRTTTYAETLAAISALSDLNLEPGELVGTAVQLVAQVSQLDWAGVGVLRGGTLEVDTVWSAPDLPPSLLAPLMRQTAAGEGLVWQVVDSEAPRFVEDYPAWPGARADLVRAGLQGAVMASLGTFQDTQYLLAAVRRMPQLWSRADRDLYQVATRTVAGALLRQERERRLAHEATRDPLTGLGNRRALEAALLTLPAPAGVAMVDLDGFKQVNDREGHPRGDVLLRLFAGAFAAELPDDALLYRLGGDEFVVLYPQAGDLEGLQADVLQHLDGAVATARAAGFQEVGASFGVALWSAGAPDPQAALALADQHMYEDKRRRATFRKRAG